MSFLDLFKKNCFFLLFLLPSCSCGPCWVYREVDTSCPSNNSAFLSYPVLNGFNGIEVQLLRGDFGTLAYLNIPCREIPPLPDAPRYANVLLIIEEDYYSFQAIRMEGGQRLLLPDEATDLLIHALLNCVSVVIALPSHYAEICPMRFESLYRKFCALPVG